MFQDWDWGKESVPSWYLEENGKALWSMAIQIGIVMTAGYVIIGQIVKGIQQAMALATRLYLKMKGTVMIKGKSTEECEHEQEPEPKMHWTIEVKQLRLDYSQFCSSTKDIDMLVKNNFILQVPKGILNREYCLYLDLPSKEDLMKLLALPPYHILPKHETTFSSGILARSPHGIKILIHRDTRGSCSIGLFVRIGDKYGERVNIPEIKGNIQGLERKSYDASSTRAASSPTDISFLRQDPDLKWKLEGLRDFDYYKLNCKNWPVRESILKIVLTVTRM